MAEETLQTAAEEEPEVLAQMLLLASSQHDIPRLRALLRKGVPATVQDEDTGYTPLHTAIAAAAEDKDGGAINGNGVVTNGDSATNGHTAVQEPEPEDGAVSTLKLLLQNGAIWNDLDLNGDTPGCLARKLGLKECYEVMVDAGVRAELLLNRLDSYAPLGEDSDPEEDENPEVDAGDVVINVEESTQTHDESNLAAADVNSRDYLASQLAYTESRLTDADQNGVMMAWETQIMERSAELLLPTAGQRVLNVGFGMGIIDTEFQKHAPSSHHIIEAHPEVLKHMREEGWFDKPGVVVHEGKWQDILPRLLEKGETFDGVYFDTFAEDYKALRTFFQEFMVGLLDEEGRFGFFNGLGADRQICYDVYTKVVEMDLFEAGFDTEWEVIDVPDLDRSGEWEGVRRRYWVLEKYRLPICKFMA